VDLPELAERDATGAKAAIYAEIRQLGGVPMVALIFRHLATLPGALEWTWAAMAPAWRSGQVQESAWRVAREVPLLPLAAMPRTALAVLGVDDEALDEIDVVLAAYNRANPENLLTILCLLRLVDGHAARRAFDARPWSPPAAAGPLVPMGDIGSLPAEVAALLQIVAAPVPAGSPRVVQSLYRHFTHRPAFLALAVTLLRQRFDDGSIDTAAMQVHEAMSRVADEIVAPITAPVAPHPGIGPVCATFAGRVIPQMIVVGRLLHEALDGRWSASTGRPET
jgi:Flp pilus assembly pilin Flp